MNKTKPSNRWIGHKDMRRGTLRANAWTCDELPDVVVRHCGHPTALRPYFVQGTHGPVGLHSSLLTAQVSAELDAYCYAVHGQGIADADPDNAVWRALCYGDSIDKLRALIDRLGAREEASA